MSEREVLPLDVVFIGAGPANMAGAYHLGRRIQQHNELVQAGKIDGEPIEVEIAILEKGKDIGAHAFSGAVLDPRTLRELFPHDWEDAPFEGKVENDQMWWLTEDKAFPMPVPPPMDNHGKYVVSLGRLLKWFEPKLEEVGVEVFCEFPAAQALLENGRVIGVRTGDRGISKEGEKKANYEPGADIHARVTVLGEGPRGTLAKQLDGELGLSEGKNPQVYAIGIKEVWELPEGRVQAGDVIHTVHWPLGTDVFGGGFIYGMKDDQLIIGLVIGLDYENPRLDPHEEFQRFKTHPRIRQLLEGGKMAFYGAKAIPEGGWWSMPKLWGDGFLLCGDSGGFLNGQRLKGIHLAMKSGMLAADTIFEALKESGDGEITAAQLARYEQLIERSWVKREMYGVRNFHQAFDKGLWAGMANAALSTLTAGRGWGLFDRLHTEPGHSRMAKLDTPAGQALEERERMSFDGELTFDKLADIYNSGTSHDEDQPVHLKVRDTNICVDQCTVEYGNPCQYFCPAAVYEMVEDGPKQRLQINASNCVHCKTCDIMDPYQIIDWVTPEGGGGPSYSRM